MLGFFRRRIGKVILGLFVLVLVGLVLAVIFIDSIAATAIEEGAGFALGVDVELEDADVGITSGKFAMSGLKVANPEEFTIQDHIVTLGKGEVEVSLGSLMEDTVKVPRLVLSDIHLVMEKREDGKANYEVLMDNLKRFESQDSAAEEPKEGGDTAEKEPDPDAKRFVVEEIIIRNVKVDAYLIKIGDQKPRPFEGHIDEIKARFDSKEGESIEGLTALILKTILKSVATNLVGSVPGLFKDGIVEGLEGLESLGSSGVELAGDAVGAVGDTAGDVAEGVGEALKGVGGLFGGGEKKKESDTNDDE